MKYLWAFLFLCTSTTLLGGDYAAYGYPSNHSVIVKKHYSVMFDCGTKIPRWVVYDLSDKDLSFKRKRSGKWKADRSLIADCMMSDKDYRNNDYDKGHLVPSADMVRSAEAMQDTFTFANCAPQAKEFNRGAWSYLENKVRKWAKSHKYVISYTGVGFNNGKPSLRMGKRCVPDYFYKVIFDPKKMEAVAFIGENLPTTIETKQVTVSELEKTTGTNLFNTLPVDVQTKIKNKIYRWR